MKKMLVFAIASLSLLLCSVESQAWTHHRGPHHAPYYGYSYNPAVALTYGVVAPLVNAFAQTAPYPYSYPRYPYPAYSSYPSTYNYSYPGYSTPSYNNYGYNRSYRHHHRHHYRY